MEVFLIICFSLIASDAALLRHSSATKARQFQKLRTKELDSAKRRIIKLHQEMKARNIKINPLPELNDEKFIERATRDCDDALSMAAPRFEQSNVDPDEAIEEAEEAEEDAMNREKANEVHEHEGDAVEEEATTEGERPKEPKTQNMEPEKVRKDIKKYKDRLTNVISDLVSVQMG